MDPEILCYPLAVKMENNRILKLYIGFHEENKPKLVFLDASGEIYEITDKDGSSMPSTVAKRGYQLIGSELSEKNKFKFKDLDKALEKLEKDL